MNRNPAGVVTSQNCVSAFTSKIMSCIFWGDLLLVKDTYFLINVNLHIERGKKKKTLLTEELFSWNLLFCERHLQRWWQSTQLPTEQHISFSQCAQEWVLQLFFGPQLLKKKCELLIIFVGEHYLPAFPRLACSWLDQAANTNKKLKLGKWLKPHFPAHAKLTASYHFLQRTVFRSTVS